MINRSITDGAHDTVTTAVASALPPLGGRVLREVDLAGQPMLLRPPAHRLRPQDVHSIAEVARDPVQHMTQPTAEKPDTAAQGYEEGMRRGLEAGRMQAQAEFEHAREAMQQAFQAQVAKMQQEVDAQAREKMLALEQELRAKGAEQLRLVDQVAAAYQVETSHHREAMEDELLVLCHAVVCKVMGEEGLKPAVVASYVHAATATLAQEEAPEVLLHPEDFMVLEEILAKAGTELPAAVMARLAQVRWLSSSDISLGGCVVRGRRGGVDARWETQLQELREVLRRERAVRQSAIREGS